MLDRRAWYRAEEAGDEHFVGAENAWGRGLQAADVDLEVEDTLEASQAQVQHWTSSWPCRVEGVYGEGPTLKCGD